jgi:hypothetical protein
MDRHGVALFAVVAWAIIDEAVVTSLSQSFADREAAAEHLTGPGVTTR